MSSPASLRALVIHADAHTRQSIIQDLAAASPADVSVWECDHPVAGKEAASELKAHVVFLDLENETDMALESIPSLCATGARVIGLLMPILRQSGHATLTRSAIRQGAYDFLDLPLRREDVLEVTHRIRTDQESSGVKTSQEGRAFGFLGTKGGVGTTTLALNLAAALARNSSRKVAFIDGNLQFGDAAAHQGLEITRTLNDLDQNMDPTLRLEQWLDLDLRSRVYFLHRPLDFRHADDISPQKFTRALVRVLQLVDIVVVDLPSRLDLFTYSALEVCCRSVMVTDPKPCQLERTQTLQQGLMELGLKPERLVCAVNRPGKLDDDELPEALSGQAAPFPTVDFPYDARLPELFGTGATAVIDRPRSPFAKQLLELAHLLEKGKG